jgi:hypothetical protein
MKKHVLAAFSAALVGIVWFGHAQASEWHVDVINRTSRTMVHFYVSNSGPRNWEEVVGWQALEVGQSVRLNINDGNSACLFDLRAEFAGGLYAERRRHNVCEETSS